jgi:hypothetical protein
MTTYSIVKGLDVVGNIFCGRRTIFIDMLFDAFFFQTAEKRFCHRIIPTVTPSAHAGLKMIRAAKSPPGIASIL